MALFTSALVDEVTTLLDRRQQTLQQPTLAEDLRLLIRIANGEVERFQGTSEETRRFLAPIEDALQRVLDALLGSAWAVRPSSSRPTSGPATSASSPPVCAGGSRSTT